VWNEPGVEESPQIAMKTNERSDVWSVDISPLIAESKIDQTLHVAVGRDAMRLVYEADVRPGTRNRFQIPLAVPANLIVGEVVIQLAERRIPVRWVRAAEDQINIFFSEELADQCRLTLRGTAPRNADGSYGLPLISAESLLAAAQLRLGGVGSD
jgi:hypothetical protein